MEVTCCEEVKEEEVKPIIATLMSDSDPDDISSRRFYRAVNTTFDGSETGTLIEGLKTICPNASAVYLLQDPRSKHDPAAEKVDTAFGPIPALSNLRFHLDNISEIIPFESNNAEVLINATDGEEEDNLVPISPVSIPLASFVPLQVSEIIIYDDNVANFYTSTVQLGLEECQEVYRQSCGRFQNETYVNSKAIRLGSSHFQEVIRRRAEVNKEFLDKLFNCKDLPPTTGPALNLGHRQVFEVYKKEMDKLERRISVRDGGLIINPTCPYLAASADGQVVDPTLDQAHGLVKLIFPQKYRNISLLEAAKKSDFCSPLRPDGKMALKKGHAYFTQIQGMLALSGLSWCDLVLCTKGGICIERIERDDAHFQNIFGRLTEFYFTKCLPYLADKFGSSDA